MTEYIERDKALEEYDAWIESTGALPKGTSYYYECRGCIEEVPAADVAQVRHGRWEVLEYYRDGGTAQRCDQCKELMFFQRTTPKDYCPNCGAKMDLECETR